jgi:hypothetical protein
MAPKKPVEKSEAIEPDEVVAKENDIDLDLVDEAVDEIRKTLDRTTHRAAAEIGAYVLERFFEDDVEKALQGAKSKETSFASLTARCQSAQLPISKTFLHNALWAAVACKSLPEDCNFKQLPPTHQAVLLPLRHDGDFASVENLAERAVKKELSVKSLRDAVATELEKLPRDPTRGGRPPKKLIMRTLDRSLKAFAFDGGKRSITKADVEDLSNEEAKEARVSAEKLVRQVNSIIDKLNQRET